MIQQTPAREETYLAAFDTLVKNGLSQGPSWLHDLRRTAIAEFRELGIPTARRGNEEWKYTDLRPLARIPFQTLLAPSAAALKAADIRPFSLGQYRWNRLVFVDGRYSARLSKTSDLPEGVCAMGLVDAISSKPSLVQQHLGRHADYRGRAFTALNTAFVHEGAFLYIPDGVRIEGPVHLMFLFTTLDQDLAFHPRVLVVAGRESEATIVESYSGLAENRYFANAVTEIVLGAGAVVKHCRVQRHSQQAFHIGTTQVVLGRDSQFASTNVDLGGGLVRNNLDVLTAEESSSCTLNGVYLVTGEQQVDNQIIIDHAKPYTTSRELYKGVLGGRARAVFHGSIKVRPGARKVDAHQEDKNLLLSNEAEAFTKPAFWIYCDDVKCGHGAACGQLDEGALFYLRSRGLDEEAAKRLLVRAFVNEIVGTIGNEKLRVHVDELVAAKLQTIIASAQTSGVAV